MLDRVFVRLVRAAERQRWHVAFPFMIAAWVTAGRMLEERLTVFAGHPLGRAPFPWFAQIAAFYVALVFAIGAVIAKLLGTPWRTATRLAGLGLLLGIVPPWIDVVVSGPGNFAYEYGSDPTKLPWLLYAPPRMLPVGETIVLWGGTAFIAILGLWKGRGWRRFALGPAFYGLVLLFQALLPAATVRLATADAAVRSGEWKTLLFLVAAALAHVVGAGLSGRALARVPQVLLAPLLSLAGSALHGRLGAEAWYAATLFALISLGFALGNDWYDRAEDAHQGRPSLVEEDSAVLLAFIGVFAAVATCAQRLELGLCALAFAAVSHAYHADPLRTKCVFPLSYKTEGLLGGAAFLGGLVAAPEAMPTGSELAAALAVALGLPAAAVFKDWKDVDADREGGVRTAFVVGEARGVSRETVRKLAAGLLLVALAVPLGWLALRGTPPPFLVALGVAALAAPAVFLALKVPQRAVIAGVFATEAFLGLAVVALAATPKPASETPHDPGEAALKALAYLEKAQRPDGAITTPPGALVVWDTIAALQALEPSGPAEVRQKAWDYLRASVRDDGVAYHEPNRGTDHGDLETTALFHATARGRADVGSDGLCAWLAAHTRPDGAMTVGTETRLVPDALQAYPSVPGFALLLAPECPDWRASSGDAVLARAREAAVRPAAIVPAWQYYGTEWYALAHLALGLKRSGELTQEVSGILVDFARARQRPDGSFARTPGREPPSTSDELHALLALHAVATADPAGGADVLRKGVAWLVTRQRPDGSFDGGAFRGAQREDVYATALFARLVR